MPNLPAQSVPTDQVLEDPHHRRSYDEIGSGGRDEPRHELRAGHRFVERDGDHPLIVGDVEQDHYDGDDGGVGHQVR